MPLSALEQHTEPRTVSWCCVCVCESVNETYTVKCFEWSTDRLEKCFTKAFTMNSGTLVNFESVSHTLGAVNSHYSSPNVRSFAAENTAVQIFFFYKTVHLHWEPMGLGVGCDDSFKTIEQHQTHSSRSPLISSLDMHQTLITCSLAQCPNFHQMPLWSGTRFWTILLTCTEIEKQAAPKAAEHPCQRWLQV